VLSLDARADRPPQHIKIAKNDKPDAWVDALNINVAAGAKFGICAGAPSGAARSRRSRPTEHSARGDWLTGCGRPTENRKVGGSTPPLATPDDLPSVQVIACFGRSSARYVVDPGRPCSTGFSPALGHVGARNRLGGQRPDDGARETTQSGLAPPEGGWLSRGTSLLTWRFGEAGGMKRANWPCISRAVARTGVIMRERLDDDVRAEVVSALSRLLAQGCPLPVPTQREAMAEVGMRRWLATLGVTEADPERETSESAIWSRGWWRRSRLTAGWLGHS
jgi:hypothetical protein